MLADASPNDASLATNRRALTPRRREPSPEGCPLESKTRAIRGSTTQRQASRLAYPRPNHDTRPSWWNRLDTRGRTRVTTRTTTGSSPSTAPRKKEERDKPFPSRWTRTPRPVTQKLHHRSKRRLGEQMQRLPCISPNQRRRPKSPGCGQIDRIHAWKRRPRRQKLGSPNYRSWPHALAGT